MKAIIDIDELKQFNSSLGSICGMLRERKENVNKKFQDLKEVWRDKNYRQFEKTFVDTTAEIDQFLKYAEAYSNYLMKKAQLAERYLEGRY